MEFSLKESAAIAGMAKLLYDFLPGSGSRVTFGTVAQEVGVGHYWPGGSKNPAIIALLEQTLKNEPRHFQPLIRQIVRRSLAYRQHKDNPLTRYEVEALNQFLLNLGFKFPELWDRSFLDSLVQNTRASGKEVTNEGIQQQSTKPPSADQRHAELIQLKNELMELQTSTDRQAAGFSFEKLLNKLFMLFDLTPREPFRVLGEQIDGSIELDHDVYLIEAKWEKSLLPVVDLLVFRGKIEGKSAFTRGIFIALNGISKPAKVAITQGKQPTFFVLDGYDLLMVLSEEISLIDLLRQRRRLLAEEGMVFASDKRK